MVAGDSAVRLAVAIGVDLGGCVWFCELEILLEFLGLCCVNAVVVVAGDLWVVVVRWWWPVLWCFDFVVFQW